MSDTLFSRIISGELPSFKVYEDDKVFAFLDIHPLSRGHTLLIPKEPAETIDRLSEDSAAALGRVLPRICRAVMAATGARACNVLQNNGRSAHQMVMHVHFHVIPKYEDGSGLEIGWPARPLGPQEGKPLAEAIAHKLTEA